MRKGGVSQYEAAQTLMSKLGSSLSRQPTSTVVVLTIPAETKLLGLGSMSGSTAMPSPLS